MNQPKPRPAAIQQVRNIRGALPLRGHQHHDRPRSFTGSLAVRPIRCNRRPSVIVTGRTNTSAGRPIATSENSPGSSLPYSTR
jgi:hypothetical protein